MDLIKKLQEIKEHFNNISDEDFEKNLINAGYGEIKPSSKSNMELLSEEILEKEITTYMYTTGKTNYNFKNDKNYYNSMDNFYEVA